MSYFWVQFLAFAQEFYAFLHFLQSLFTFSQIFHLYFLGQNSQFLFEFNFGLYKEKLNTSWGASWLTQKRVKNGTLTSLKSLCFIHSLALQTKKTLSGRKKTERKLTVKCRRGRRRAVDIAQSRFASSAVAECREMWARGIRRLCAHLCVRK